MSRKGQRESRTLSNASRVNYPPSDVPTYSPQISCTALERILFFHLSPLALYSDKHSLCWFPLRLNYVGQESLLIRSIPVMNSFYSLSSSVMKILPSTLCLHWHPTTSLYHASSLSHIQLSFKYTPPCSSFVVVCLRCCSMFMECSFTGKIPWPKPLKGTTHLGLIFHDTFRVHSLGALVSAVWTEDLFEVRNLKIAELKLHLIFEKSSVLLMSVDYFFHSHSIIFWQVSAILSYENMK